MAKRTDFKRLLLKIVIKVFGTKHIFHFVLPGTLLANSTTLCTVGVMCTASCCHNHIFCCSSLSAVEDATSGLEHPCAGFS